MDLLGCDAAAGDVGNCFIAALEMKTGLNFAASDDRTTMADFVLESDAVDVSHVIEL